MSATGPGCLPPSCSASCAAPRRCRRERRRSSRALIAAIEQDPAAQELLASDGDPGAVARRHCARSTAMRARRCPATSTSSATGSSTASTSREPSALELPDVLLRAIRTARRGRRERGPDVEAQTAGDPRARCPPSTRTSSTSSSARRGCSTGSATSAASTATSGPRGSCAGPRSRPAAGSPRDGRIDEPVHFIDAGFDEMCALVSGSGGPSADELAARAAYRAAPQRQGRAADARPSAAAPAGPGHAADRRSARLMRGDGHRPRRAVRQLRGGARGATCCAASRRAAASTRARHGSSPGPADFNRIVQGDVLVTDVDDGGVQHPAAALGAIVTDSGGLLSHSAIVAREYGIPGRRRDARGRRSGSRTARACASTAMPARSPSSHERGRPTRGGGRDGGLRLEGGRPRAGATRRPAGPAGRRALRARSSRPSPAGTRTRSSRSQPRSGRSVGRWRCARPRSTRTAPTRASPAST